MIPPEALPPQNIQIGQEQIEAAAILQILKEEDIDDEFIQPSPDEIIDPNLPENNPPDTFESRDEALVLESGDEAPEKQQLDSIISCNSNGEIKIWVSDVKIPPYVPLGDYMTDIQLAFSRALSSAYSTRRVDPKKWTIQEGFIQERQNPFGRLGRYGAVSYTCRENPGVQSQPSRPSQPSQPSRPPSIEVTPVQRGSYPPPQPQQVSPEEEQRRREEAEKRRKEEERLKKMRYPKKYWGTNPQDAPTLVEIDKKEIFSSDPDIQVGNKHGRMVCALFYKPVISVYEQLEAGRLKLVFRIEGKNLSDADAIRMARKSLFKDRWNDYTELGTMVVEKGCIKKP